MSYISSSFRSRILLTESYKQATIVLYPQGRLSSSKMFLYNHDDLSVEISVNMLQSHESAAVYVVSAC